MRASSLGAQPASAGGVAYPQQQSNHPSPPLRQFGAFVPPSTTNPHYSSTLLSSIAAPPQLTRASTFSLTPIATAVHSQPRTRATLSYTPIHHQQHHQQHHHHQSAATQAAAFNAANLRSALSTGAQTLIDVGGIVTVYIGATGDYSTGAHTYTTYFTRLVTLFYDNASRSLYWCDPPPAKREMRDSHAIPVQKLTAITVGKKSEVFQSLAVSADPERCFTLRWATDELIDIECENEQQRTDWLEVLEFVLADAGRTVVEVQVEEKEEAADGPIDPMCRAPMRKPHRPTMTQSQTSSSPHPAVAAAAGAPSTTTVPLLPSHTFFGLATPLDLSFSTRKSRIFTIVDRATPYGGSSSPTLGDALRQFELWNDLPTRAPSIAHTPVRGSPTNRTRASMFIDALDSSSNRRGSPSASPTRNKRSATVISTRSPSSVKTSTAQRLHSVLNPKEDVHSLEGSLAKLGGGVKFIYCTPLGEMEDSSGGDAILNTTTSSASSSAFLPGQPHPSSPTAAGGTTGAAPAAAATPPSHQRRLSYSECVTSILLFFQPQSRRTSSSIANFGQLSWCDSQAWTRKSNWKMTVQIDTVIILGKVSANFQRDVYSSIPHDQCLSIQNGTGDVSIDLICETGWQGIKSWLTALERVLRSSGWCMVRLTDEGRYAPFMSAKPFLTGSANATAPGTPTASKDRSILSSIAGPGGLTVSTGSSSSSFIPLPKPSSAKLVFVSVNELKMYQLSSGTGGFTPVALTPNSVAIPPLMSMNSGSLLRLPSIEDDLTRSRNAVQNLRARSNSSTNFNTTSSLNFNGAATAPSSTFGTATSSLMATLSHATSGHGSMSATASSTFDSTTLPSSNTFVGVREKPFSSILARRSNDDIDLLDLHHPTAPFGGGNIISFPNSIAASPTASTTVSPNRSKKNSRGAHVTGYSKTDSISSGSTFSFALNPYASGSSFTTTAIPSPTGGAITANSNPRPFISRPSSLQTPLLRGSIAHHHTATVDSNTFKQLHTLGVHTPNSKLRELTPTEENPQE